MSLTAQLAGIIRNTTFESLGTADVATAKRLIADGIAVAVAGSQEQAPQMFAEHVKEQGGREQCPVWGFGFKTSPVAAAYANAVSMHVLDFEPMSRPSTHAVSPTVPVAFALALRDGLDGRELLTACAKGFEMQGRLLAAVDHRRESSKFHAPGVVGPFGSAVVAGHLLGLDEDQLNYALAIAASRSGALRANIGHGVKCTHCGNAAAAGLEAALLAKRGLTANADILAHVDGFAAAFFPKGIDRDMLLGYGKPFRFSDPGMAIKFYPSKYPTHFAISAALEVRKMIADPALINAVNLITPSMPDVDRPAPVSGLEGKFSFQYAAACALLDGKVGIASFHDQRRFRGDMKSMLRRMKVTVDPSLPTTFHQMQVSIEVTLHDGSLHRAACTRPPGFWGAPLDIVQHREKLRDCLMTRLDAGRTAQVTGLLESLESLPAAAVRELSLLLE
jgi:2-methylcitrate dehydratase PrpD